MVVKENSRIWANRHTKKTKETKKSVLSPYILYSRYNKLTELHTLQIKASPWKLTISGLNQKHKISFLVL
jgi:hypothetical protein